MDEQDIQDTGCAILSILSINVNFRKPWSNYRIAG